MVIEGTVVLEVTTVEEEEEFKEEVTRGEEEDTSGRSKTHRQMMSYPDLMNA